MTDWTREQLRAIEEKGDLLVSAGAGSGKTAVLTARITRLIKEGADIRDILCVTFTRAAAAEMKKRIERSLYEAADKESDEGEAQRLYDAARGTNGASISTIDSFCNQALHRHFNIAGLDPSFRPADENETAPLLEEVWDALCEERYCGDRQREFSRLMDALGGDERAYGAMMSLYDVFRSKPDPISWLEEAVSRYDISAEALSRSEEIAELMASDKRGILLLSDRLAGMRDTVAEDYPELAAFLDEETLSARSLSLFDTAEGFASALAAEVDHSATGRTRINWQKMDEARRKPVENARKKLLSARKSAAEFWSVPMEARARELMREKPLMDELLCVMKELDARYAEYKSERNIIDYGDIEHMALGILKNGDVAAEYRKRYRYIFLDEYQDCNAVQEEIIASIAGPGSLFLVGDVKQSIYRFRLAEPELFMKRYEAYSRGEGTKIDLNANFRSSLGVVNAVNSVFERIMTRDVAELDYDASARLIHARSEDGTDGISPNVRLELVDLAGMEAPEGEELPGAARAEAELAAKLICDMMQNETVPDGNGGRRAPRYSDFAVLLRSPKNAADDWMRALSLSGIPSYAVRAGGYFDAVEVRVFLELLRVVDNARQDIPMASVLRSPMGGFTTEELIALRADYPAPPEKADGWRCLDQLRAAAQYETELGQKARAFIEKLARWQREARLVNVETLIGRLLDETDYMGYCRALPGGRQREANLEALPARARQCASSGANGLHSFLEYTDKLINIGASGAPQTAGADVVRIMSVHASKGLEFPFVLLGGLGHNFKRNGDGDIYMDGGLGVAARFVIDSRETCSVYLSAIKERQRDKSTAEEMRILYVGMTRAREKLIMISAAPRLKRLVEDASLPESSAGVAAGKSFAEWILGAVLHSSDGDALRKRFGLPHKTGLAPMGIAVSLSEAASFGLYDSRMSESEFALFEREALELPPAFDGLFGSEYAYEADTAIPSKVSVTGLAGHEITMAEAPAFMLEERMSAADRGTAMHALMQRVSIRKHTAKTVAEEAASLAERGIITEAQRDAADCAAIARFFSTQLGERLIASGNVRRELEFDLRMPARELMEVESDAPVILQGVIDCCFWDEGEWVLVDYKTDSIPRGVTAREAAKKHMRQLALYTDALNKLTGVAVKESYVFMLSRGEAVPLEESV